MVAPLLGKMKKGYTLIEVVAAMFIFSILMMASSQVFAKTFQSYREIRAVQKDTENAQFVLASFVKELRTSSIVAPAAAGMSSSVQFFEHSQGICFKYRVNAGALELASVAATDTADCRGKSPASFVAVSTGLVSGSFQIIPSTLAPLLIGKITVSLDIAEGTHHVKLQTSASLRDYGTSGF